MPRAFFSTISRSRRSIASAADTNLSEVRMRRVLSFACAAGLVSIGGYIILVNIAYTHGVYLRGLGTAAILLFVGGGWLWADFIAPLVLGQRKS
jgi:hypothetical protein